MQGEAAKHPYELIMVHDAAGYGGSYALLMHSALLARARGKQGFIHLPPRKLANGALVMFGDPGDPGVPAALVLNAETVIGALKPDFEEPVKR